MSQITKKIPDIYFLLGFNAVMLIFIAVRYFLPPLTSQNIQGKLPAWLYLAICFFLSLIFAWIHGSWLRYRLASLKHVICHYKIWFSISGFMSFFLLFFFPIGTYLLGLNVKNQFILLLFFTGCSIIPAEILRYLIKLSAKRVLPENPNG